MIWLHCDDSEAPRGHTPWHRSFQRCGPGCLFMLGCSTISLAARGRSIQMMCWFFPAVLLKFHMRSDAALDPFAAAFANATAGQFNGAITPRSSATNMKIGHSSSTQPSALLLLKLAESAGVSMYILSFFFMNQGSSAFSDP